MKLAEFQDLLDAHGADPFAWPDDLRSAAKHLVATEPAAQASLRAAQRIEHLIARGMKAQATPVDASAARVLAGLARELPRQRRFELSWPAALLQFDLAPARLRIAALAGVACLGVALGLFGPDVGAGDSPPAAGSTSSETNLTAVFEPEPLTGVRP
jgi:hypothetical protein